MTPEDQQLLESYAIEKARQEAERKHIERYSSAQNPDSLLQSAIFEIIASTASAVLDRELSDPVVSMTPDRYPEWHKEMRPRLIKRLEDDYVFGALVRSQAALIAQEVEAYKAGGMAREHRAYMRLRPELSIDAVMEERERCATIADEAARVAGTTDTAGIVADSIAEKIRSGK